MSGYVFDTSSLSIFNAYPPKSMPSVWEKLDAYVEAGKIISVREVYRELQSRAIKPHLQKWIEANKSIFYLPSREETKFVNTIFEVPHFQALISEKQRLVGNPVADPFVIAAGKIRSVCVVTEEEKKPHAAKIPNVCDHFKIECRNLEKFMEIEKWEI